MFDDAQVQWLMDSLVSSRAPFKIIAGGNQMMNPLTPFEAFGRKREERKLLLRTLDATGKEWWRHEISASELTFTKI